MYKKEDFRYTFTSNTFMSVGQTMCIITPEHENVSGVVTKVQKIKNKYCWEITLKIDKPLIKNDNITAISSRGE